MIPVPEAPDWRIDWPTIANHPWVPAMQASSQDPISHAEGDVWTHTGMVVEALVADPDWRILPADRRAATFYAAVLHDVAKPQTRVEEKGRIRNPGHSAKGALIARGLLWEMGIDRAIREQACTIILMHQTPFWLIERPEWKQVWSLAQTALTCHPGDVALHARADALGRVCPDQGQILDHIALYEVAAAEVTALHAGRIFANDEARVRYFGDPEHRSLHDVPPDRTSEAFEMLVMSGLPGSGKSTLARQLAAERDLPVVSLDALRTELDIPPDRNQGPVIQAALERAKTHLRQRRSVIWDSTNISRDQRGRVLGMAHAYGARSHIVAVERSKAASRAGDHASADWVPDTAVARMVARWEAPTLAECHVLTLA